MLLDCGVGEDSWESLGLQGDPTSQCKGNQPWIFIGRPDAEAPILWPPDEKSWLIGKHPDAGKGWGQEGKRAVEDEMIGWHRWVNGHESEQTPGDGEGQGSLVGFHPLIRKELDTTEWLSNNSWAPSWPGLNSVVTVTWKTYQLSKRLMNFMVQNESEKRDYTVMWSWTSCFSHTFVPLQEFKGKCSS